MGKIHLQIPFQLFIARQGHDEKVGLLESKYGLIQSYMMYGFNQQIIQHCNKASTTFCDIPSLYFKIPLQKAFRHEVVRENNCL